MRGRLWAHFVAECTSEAEERNGRSADALDRHFCLRSGGLIRYEDLRGATLELPRAHYLRWGRPRRDYPQQGAGPQRTHRGRRLLVWGLSDRASWWDFLGVSTFSGRHRRLQTVCRNAVPNSEAARAQRVVSGCTAGAPDRYFCLRRGGLIRYDDFRGDAGTSSHAPPRGRSANNATRRAVKRHPACALRALSVRSTDT
jgi:hypothetical protein